MMSNFKQRYIQVIIGIGEGVLGDQVPQQFWTLDNHRISANISMYGGETQGTASVKIYGMTASDMNKLTAIGPVMYQLKSQNTIMIKAGDDLNNLSNIYFGVIQEAFADFNNAPDVYLNITAQSASIAALTIGNQYSQKGAQIPVSQIMSTLAGWLKWEFRNLDVGIGNMGVGGADVFLPDPAFSGSYLEQIKACAEKANIVVWQEATSSTSILKIMHKGSSFNESFLFASPQLNMIGYPVYSQKNMTVKTLFMPDAALGATLTVTSSFIASANRDWIIHTVVHDLENMTHSGKWQTTLGVMPQ